MFILLISIHNMNFIYLPVQMESSSSECDCGIKLKEQQEEMKACYKELDKRVCELGQKSLESIRQTLEESESVKSQVDKNGELKAEKEDLEKSSNCNKEGAEKVKLSFKKEIGKQGSLKKMANNKKENRDKTDAIQKFRRSWQNWRGSMEKKK